MPGLNARSLKSATAIIIVNFSAATRRYKRMPPENRVHLLLGVCLQSSVLFASV